MSRTRKRQGCMHKRGRYCDACRADRSAEEAARRQDDERVRAENEVALQRAVMWANGYK